MPEAFFPAEPDTLDDFLDDSTEEEATIGIQKQLATEANDFFQWIMEYPLDPKSVDDDCKKFVACFTLFYQELMKAALANLQAWRTGQDKETSLIMNWRAAIFLTRVSQSDQAQQKFLTMLLSTVPTQVQRRLGQGDVRTLISDLAKMDYFSDEDIGIYGSGYELALYCQGYIGKCRTLFKVRGKKHEKDYKLVIKQSREPPPPAAQPPPKIKPQRVHVHATEKFTDEQRSYCAFALVTEMHSQILDLGKRGNLNHLDLAVALLESGYITILKTLRKSGRHDASVEWVKAFSSPLISGSDSWTGENFSWPLLEDWDEQAWCPEEIAIIVDVFNNSPDRTKLALQMSRALAAKGFYRSVSAAKTFYSTKLALKELRTPSSQIRVPSIRKPADDVRAMMQLVVDRYSTTPKSIHVEILYQLHHDGTALNGVHNQNLSLKKAQITESYSPEIFSRVHYSDLLGYHHSGKHGRQIPLSAAEQVVIKSVCGARGESSLLRNHVVFVGALLLLFSPQ